MGIAMIPLAHVRFRLLTRKSLVGFLLIVIAFWGVLSTTAVSVEKLLDSLDKE